MTSVRPTHRNRARRRLSDGRRAAAAVECALSMIVLIPLFCLCADFGRFAHAYIAVTNAARVGAGYASTHPFGPADQAIWEYQTRMAVVRELGDLKEYAIVTSPEFGASTDDPGHDYVKVKVQYRFMPLFMWMSEMTLEREVEMRHLAS